jgi:CRP-like cAMP-binding protein
VEVEVGCTYSAPPNDVKAVLQKALLDAPLVLRMPPPTVLIKEFAASSVNYLVQFWIGDYALQEQARDQVRTNIWYALRRANIEIPFPIQVEVSREELPLRSEGDVLSAAARLGAIDLFATLPQESRVALSRTAQEHIFAAGEAIVRQGESGNSLYVVLGGRVRIVLEPSGQEVAVTEAGGFFGEMSMLTGEPRTATVRAIGDVRLLEITADRFREVALDRPGLVEHVSSVVAERREELADARATAAASTSAGATRRTIFGRIQQFLRLP